MVRVSKPELHRTISEIMRKGNLDQLTTKKIRILCEEKYNIDLSSRRDEIDKIVMAFVKKKSEAQSNESSNDESSSYETDEEGSSCSSESCTGSECSYSDSSEEETSSNKKVNTVSCKPSPKKMQTIQKVSAPQKRNAASQSDKDLPSKGRKMDIAATKQIEMDDAAYARQLQAEEWNFRQRTVRKMFPSRSPQKRNGKTDQNRKKRATPFAKKCILSPALAELLGVNEMSRSEVVQKMCSIIKERKLFDTNKQYAVCDEQMRKIFGKKRVRIIGMMKYLKHHIKDIEK